MCKLKSGIILKNRVFVPEYDSHTDMLEELGIEDNYLNASKTFVRVELSPKYGNVFSDIDDWELRVDQDIIPDWYDEDTYRPQVVEAVKEWAKGFSTTIGSPYGWNKKDALILAENATFKDCCTKTIYQSGDWKLVSVKEKGEREMKTCKDCLHYETCKDYGVDEVCEELSVCKQFTDRSKWVHLPCKFLLKVYVLPTIHNQLADITEMKCIGFSLSASMYKANLIDDKNKLYQPYFGEFGKTVFLTREEAEKASEIK